MDLLSGLLGSIGGFRNATPAVQGFRSDLQVTDGDAGFNSEANVLANIGSAGVWTTIWEMTVPAQQAIRFGYGSPATPQNQGYMWFAIVDEGTGFDVGVVRLAQSNARRTRTLIVAEVADSALHSTNSTSTETAALLDKNEMYALPEKIEFPKVGEDSLIQIQYNLITAATAADAVAFKLPVTIYQ